jgi:hypothetical protein
LAAQQNLNVFGHEDFVGVHLRLAVAHLVAHARISAQKRRHVYIEHSYQNERDGF